MKRTNTRARIGAAFVLAPALLVLASGPAMAADSILISNTETVQAHLNADGTLKDARVYEQIALQGNGTVTIKNPVSTDKLRNLDGFRNFEVKDGNIVSTQTVKGEKRLRAVSDFDKVLPIKVKVTYKLDGKTVEARDVVGKSGRLDVHYKVENVTGKDQEVTYDDGTGNKVTETQKVVIPMVGSLTAVLPSNFTDVSSAEANIAGDGRGATKMSFTMTLFGPIGSPISEFGYSAAISDGLIPDAVISALPVSPLDSPSFKGGAASYKGGAETGIALTAGATEIDANVLKLRDGAATLIAGLIQLRDGAHLLNDGLAGEAAPGARKLAVGASALKAGAGKLNDGLNQASGGAPALLDGLGQVAGGLTLVDAGLVTMYGGIGQLPAKAKPIHDGIQSMLTGLGNKTTAGTLVYGVNAVRAGLAAATATGGPVDQLKGGVDAVKGGLDAALATGGDIDLLKGGAAAAQASVGCQTDPVCIGTLTAVINSIDVTLRGKTQAASDGLGQVSPGLTTLKAGLDTHAPGTFGPTDPGGAGYALSKVECGLDNRTLPTVCNPAIPGLAQGLALVDGGVSLLVSGVVSQVQGGVGRAADVAPAQSSLRGGVHAVMGGIDLLGAGGLTLQDGLDQLSAGAGQLSDGTVQLSDGANQLSSGLDDAATGSGQLADGLDTAAEGGQALPEGAAQLSAEGTSKLIVAGKTTAADYGLKYAVIVAGADRAKAEGMAYGAPVGAAGATAYSLEISGANSNGGTDVGRGVGALALFGAGGGLVLFRRRLV